LHGYHSLSETMQNLKILNSKPLILVFSISVLLFFAFPVSASFIIDAGTVTLSNSVTIEVSSDVVISGNGTLDAGDGHLNVGRRFDNNGSFICGTSTVTLYTTVVSTLTGNTTFYCLSCETAGKSLYFEASSTQTVKSAFTLEGTAANRIKLRSTIDGNKWYIRFLSSQTVQFVDVQDSDALDYQIECSESVDSGNNNENWIFLAPDVYAPCAISNLTALTGTENDGDVKLSWTAPGDDGTSGDLTDGLYRLKASTHPITSANFDSISNNPLYTYSIDISTSYTTQGTGHSYTVTGLNPGTTYYFAIKTRDDVNNWSTWSTDGVNTENSDQALDLNPDPPPSVSAISNSSTTINVSWEKPIPEYVDDIDKYFIYRATFSFSDIDTPNVVHIATVTHPTNVHLDSELTTGVTYYYRVITYDKGNQANGLFSEVLTSTLSQEASACPSLISPGKVKVSVVYDNRSSDNKNNYGIVDGIEDADGTVTWDWPFIPDGGEIVNYFVEISTDVNFGFFSSSATLAGTVSTYTVTGLSRGYYHYARVKAENNEGTVGVWTVSDGIHINRKTMDCNNNDWTDNYATVVDSIVVSGGDALWRDRIGDQRTDRGSSSQLDISSFSISCDEFNLYFYFAFASTVTAGFDGRNFVQIMIDNDFASTERVFRGRDNQYEDSYVSGDVPWEWIIEVVTGNDITRAQNSLFTDTRYGAYSENNNNYFYEVAMPLEKLGGKEKFLGKSVNFTVATFWNEGGTDGSIGQWDADNSNIVDVITSSGTNTWTEVQDKVVDYYLSVTFSTRGVVTDARGIKANFTPPPDEPQPPEAGISPAPPSALDYILYNMFIDAWYNGDTSNDDINDTNDYGGDFQGVIDKVGYLNDLGINMAYFGPPTEFGGGIWGFNIDDAYQKETKFGRTSKYIEMVKTLHNHNIKVMVDWVCGQVGSKNSPTARKNPDFFRQEQFGWGTIQEFAEARAFWLNNLIWYFSMCDAIRYDNPKFWNDTPPEYGNGFEHKEFNLALRKLTDRWDPQLFIMGEIPEGVYWNNYFTGDNGPMIHGGEDMKSGGYKNGGEYWISSWAMPGTGYDRGIGGGVSTIDLRNGLDNEQITNKNQWSINPIMMENHDERRFISRGRDESSNSPWHQQIGYMTAFTVGVSPIFFYGGELGLEGPYDGNQPAKMDRDGNVRPMPWSRLNDSTWSQVRGALKKTIHGRANFPALRGDPKKESRGWYSGVQYDGDVVVFSRTGWGQKAIVMMNRSNGNVTLNDAGTGDANTTYKDWLTDETFNTNAIGDISSIQVNSHYGRILIKNGYSTGTVSGVVNVPNAIVDVDGKSHWTTTADSGGNYSIERVLTGDHSIKAWAPGYEIYRKNETISPGDNTVDFTLAVDNTAPSAPKSLSAKPRDQAVMLSWQENTEDDIQTYLIYRSRQPIPDYSYPQPIFEVFKPFFYDNNLDGKLDSDGNVYDRLENGTTYYYRVRAVDRNGNKSALSNEIVVVPRAIKVTFWLDTRDSGLSVSSVTIAGGALAFSNDYWGKVPLEDNGDGTFQRTFEFDDTTFLEYKYLINDIWEGSAGYAFLDGSLSDSSRGELTDNSVPDVEIIDEGNGEMLLANVWRYYNDRPPRTPGGVGIIPGPNQLTVFWTKNAEPDLSYYTILRSSYSSSEGFVEIARRDKEAINLVDIGLLSNNTYYYKISATDRREKKSSYSSVVSDYPREEDTQAPESPSGLEVFGLGTHGLDGIRIEWDPNPEGDIAGYNLHRSTVSGFSTSESNKLNDTLISPVELYYADSGASLETTYYYKLVAVDSSGNASGATQVYARCVPITFKVDVGNINSEDVAIIGNTKPLYLTTGSTMTRIGVTNVYKIELGMISGTTIQYRYGYNCLETKEQNFDTNSGRREYLIPTSSTTVSGNWEENPDEVSGVTVYPGVSKAYLYWDRNTTAEDLAGYNIYRNDGTGDPDIKVNSTPVSYSQPYTVMGLNSSTTYSFLIRSCDSGSPELESTTGTVVSAYLGEQVYVNFGVPYSAGLSSSPWGDSSKIKLYLAVMSSTQTSVWSSGDRANVTNGKKEMDANKDDGTYRTVVPLLKGEYYNFIFFAETTNTPPEGLKANSEYYDVVPGDTHCCFSVSASSTSISGPQTGYFDRVSANRDSRRVIQVPSSLPDGSTWFVFANFASTPTAPTYIQPVPGNEKITLYWSQPYGREWTTVIDNVPVSAGEAMKAADVVCGGVYHIYMTTYTPGDFSSYKLTATVSGSVLSKTFDSLTNSVTYYFLMRSSDTFKGPPGGICDNYYSVLSSTVSAYPTSSYVVTKIRVNSNANETWRSVRKSIAFQEGKTVSSWDEEGRSNLTPSGRAVNMVSPPGNPDELEFSVNLIPQTTYNFILFAYSTFSISGIQTGTTYYDTVPNSGDEGMLVSTSTVSVTQPGKAWFGTVGGTGDSRRLLYVPDNLSSGTTLYVLCNFSAAPQEPELYANPMSSYSVRIGWVPYGYWGKQGEQNKAIDVIAGGAYHIWRSSVSEAGPYVLWASTSGVFKWVDDDRNNPGDNLGMVRGLEYFYVLVSSDAYCGDSTKMQIPNLYRTGEPEFSFCDASATPEEKRPVYFKVEYIDDRKIFVACNTAPGRRIYGTGVSVKIW